MTAYLIADVDVKYKREVPATEARHGGKYLARGGQTKVLEGDWRPHRLVILEFPDMDALLAWHDSPEYARLKEIREQCATTRIIALEGTAAATSQ
jgi:uncharacterized protein (DUF1330 family)